MADDFLGEWVAWRSAREDALANPHGFLSITGLYWLASTPQRFDRTPGAWWIGPDGVEVEVADFETLTLDGEEIRGRHLLGPVDADGIRARAGELQIEVASRDGAVLLRPRDPAHELLREHRLALTYPPSPDWVVPARFTPYLRPADDSIGEVAFAVAGEPANLVTFADHGGLWLVFSDATAGLTTYAAGRQLYAPAPDVDGNVLLDFNRTINLPCAYTDFTTCPVPPPQNRLPFPIEAGEQNPEKSVTATQGSRGGREN